jgi:hypothetical protein
MTRTLPGAALAAAVALLPGCKRSDFPPLYPVAGKVAFEDGKPLNHGVVEFESDTDPKWRGSARVGSDGQITDVYTYLPNGKEAAGLVAGDHSVSLSKSLAVTNKDGPTMPIPEKYTSFATTDLRAVVAEATTDLTLTLKPGKN